MDVDEWGPDNPYGDMAPILTRSIAAEKIRELPPLTLADRCDSCGAQALYRWHKPGDIVNVMEFCHHHSNANKPHLDARGWAIIESVQVPA